MKTYAGLLAVALTVLGLAGSANAQSAPDKKEAQIERGAYITHHVAMCIQCHSPRDQSGKLILSKKFQGAPMPVQSPYPNETWAFQAPNIAGLPGYSRQEALRLFMKGITRWGQPPQNPMPPFRMSREDAEAVIAYLKSLK